MATRNEQDEMRLQNTAAVQSFTISGDSHSLAEKWKRWRRSFNLYVTSKGLEDDKQKKCLLLHCAGLEVQDYYYSIVEEETDKFSYEEAVKILNDHFTPQSNIPFERHLFRQMEQLQHETVSEFVCRLRHQASNCNFGGNTDEQIRDQVIDKCRSRDLRAKFLEKADLKLTDVVSMARAFEAVGEQLKLMDRPAEPGLPSDYGVNAVQNKIDKNKLTCYACGRSGHFQRDEQCPARGKRCMLCGKMGHFRSQCRSQSIKPTQRNYGPASSAVNYLQEDKRSLASVQANECNFDIFTVKSPVAGVCCISIDVGNVRVPNVVIDSGAVTNVITKNTWDWLKKSNVQANISCSTINLFAYGSDKPLPTLCTFSARVVCCETGKSCIADFVVVNGTGTNLLGKRTAEKLAVLQVGPGVVNLVENDLVARYKPLFTGVGVLKDFKLKLHIDDSVKPVAQSPRRIPFQLRQKVNAKLQELLDSDIIEEVPEGPTTWVSPLVVIPKDDGDVRICVDMRRANEAIIRERHPIPTVEELLHQLNGSTVFSKLDLKWGFHQVVLDESSRHITTFTTHCGLFRYKRLMFGLSSAPEKYQKIVWDVLKNCEGVANIADDVIVYGSDQMEHDKRLHKVLTTLLDSGFTLNPQKCQFRMSQLTFFGHDLGKQGVSPSKEKVSAIEHAKPPKNSSEARSFMGLVQYSSKFIPDLATIARPIQDLMKKNTKFVWGEEQQNAFEKLKRAITHPQVLAFFKNDCKTRIITDASPVGLGAVLTQFQDGCWRVISYASRSLTEVEKRYSQTEKEALGIVWACERFHLYVFGKEFELETDHRPLQYIYSRKSKPSARVERWVLRLQAYDFKVIYKPGRTNIADALSRLNSTQPNFNSRHDFQDVCDIVQMIAVQSTPVALSTKDVEEESKTDSELEMVRTCLKTGNWSSCANSSFEHVKDELCASNSLILRGTRLVMPKSLRLQTLKLAHEGHQGIVKTKWRLRSKVWWPKIDSEVEDFCKRCHGCQVVSDYIPPEPMARTLPPDKPWKDCAADLMGPLPNGENILVVVDYFSRYYEIAFLSSTTSERIVESFIPIFSRLGAPVTLKTDNAPQFTSSEFKSFLEEYGVEHRTSIPLWPQSNGEVERQNRSLLKAIKIAQLESKSSKQWKLELSKFLMAYRSTPHASTGVSPFSLMFGREMRTKLPSWNCAENTLESVDEIRERDWINKLQGKLYADKRRRATKLDVKVGDEVLLKQEKKNKLSPNFNPEPCKVVEIGGGQVTVQNKQGVNITRSTGHTKQYHKPVHTDVDDPSTSVIRRKESDFKVGDSESNEMMQDSLTRANIPDAMENDVNQRAASTNHPDVSNRPKRNAGRPMRYNDYV